MRIHQAGIQAASGNQLRECGSVQINRLFEYDKRIKSGFGADDITESESGGEDL